MLPEAPSITRAAEQELMRRVQAKVRHWRGRVDENDYQDMLGEAYYRAWQSYCKGVERGVDRPLDYALHFAAMGPLTWLRDWYGRRGAGEKSAAPEVVSWEQVGGETCGLADPSPGPEEIALARLERAALWNWLRRTATGPQLAVLAAIYRGGLNAEETARAFGLTPNAIWHRHDTAIKNGRIDPFDLPGSFRPGTSYPRCARGHYLAPENIGRSETRHGIAHRCLLCHRITLAASRQRRALRRARGQQTASGGAGRDLHPPPENGAGDAS